MRNVRDHRIVQPAGSSFDYFVCEVGVNYFEGQTKQKLGPRDFSSFFKKPSKYDYLNLSKDAFKSLGNSHFSNFNDSSLNDQDKKKESYLPLITNPENTNKSYLQSSKFDNSSETTMKISNKLTNSLKATFDILEYSPQYDNRKSLENNKDTNKIINIYKKKNVNIQEQKDLEKKQISSSLDEINKFNFRILKNNNWGNDQVDKNNPELMRDFEKPIKRELEYELGKKNS